ncbi:MAG: hypothetical protein M3Y37_01765 [Chloroflexota bacterium]|nr:hypothetical protein [Chloroflexota bacterium]
MTDRLRVALEVGPKGKKHAAWAVDWPGLSRGGKNDQIALETLDAYRARYAPVAKLAGLDAEFDAITGLGEVTPYAGVGGTDFWGISFAVSPFDTPPYTEGPELEQHLTLLQACWEYFDQVRGRVSAELRKGPRGGGRDRDRMVRHVVWNEMDWGHHLGLPKLPDEPVWDEAAVIPHREAYVAAIRGFAAEGTYAPKRNLRYLIRHTAYHTLDHAWEMEDKDLTGEE